MGVCGYDDTKIGVTSFKEETSTILEKLYKAKIIHMEYITRYDYILYLCL